MIVAILTATVVLLLLGRGLTFFADEWAVIGDRPLGIATFLRPFNEHWLGVTTFVHRLMVETIGIGSYVPYLAVLLALHAIVVGEVYVIARRSTLPIVAVGVAVIVAFFGSGFENLFWAMQIGFIGAVALGFAAFLVLDGAPSRRDIAIATTLLTIGVMTSGFGLFMLAAVGLDVLLDGRRRRVVAWLTIPAAVYGAWYLTLGREGVATHGDPFTLANLLALPSFVVQGGGDAVGSALGTGHDPGIVAFLALSAIVTYRMVRGGPPPRRAIALVGAIVVQYAVLGLVRAQIGAEATLYSRYSYLSGIFALLAMADLIGRPILRRETLTGRVLIVGLSLVFVVSVAWNARLLLVGREVFAERADLTRALIELSLSSPLPDGVERDLSLVLVPSPARLAAIVSTFGSPLSDSLAADAVPPISDAARAEALRRATDPPAWLLAQPWLP